MSWPYFRSTNSTISSPTRVTASGRARTIRSSLGAETGASWFPLSSGGRVSLVVSLDPPRRRRQRAHDPEVEDRRTGGDEDRPQPQRLGVAARAEDVDDAEDVDQRRQPVGGAPALGAEAAADVERQPEDRGEVAADDAEARVERRVVDHERDGDARDARVQEVVAEQRDAV